MNKEKGYKLMTMTFDTLSQAFQAIGKEASRNKMTELLAALTFRGDSWKKLR